MSIPLHAITPPPPAQAPDDAPPDTIYCDACGSAEGWHALVTCEHTTRVTVTNNTYRQDHTGDCAGWQDGPEFYYCVACDTEISIAAILRARREGLLDQ